MEIPELPQIEIPKLKPQKQQEERKRFALLSNLFGLTFVKSEAVRSLIILGLTLSGAAVAGFVGPDIYRAMVGGRGGQKAKAVGSVPSGASSAPLNYSGGEFGSYGVDGGRAAGAGSLGMLGSANMGKLAEDQNPYGNYQPPEEEESGEDELKPTPKASGEDFLAKNLKALQKDMKDLKEMKSGVGAAGSGGGPNMPLPIEGMDPGSDKSAVSGFSIAAAKGKPGPSGKRALVGGQGSSLGQLFTAKTAAQTSYKTGSEGAGSLDSFFESGGVSAAALTGAGEDESSVSRNLGATIRKEQGRITRCSSVSEKLQPALESEQGQAVKEKGEAERKRSWVKNNCGGFWDTMGCAFGGGRCRTCSRVSRQIPWHMRKEYEHKLNAGVLNCKIWRACERDTDNRLRARLGPGVGQFCNADASVNKFDLDSACGQVIQRCLE